MPDPTPTPAGVSVGLATRIMQIVGAGFAVVAAVSAFLDGDHSQMTVLAMVLSALSFFVLAGGRYAQAVVRELAEFWNVKERGDA